MTRSDIALLGLWISVIIFVIDNIRRTHTFKLFLMNSYLFFDELTIFDTSYNNLFENADGDNKYKGNIYMVFEYMDHDLTGLADRPGLRFSVPQIKVF